MKENSIKSCFEVFGLKTNSTSEEIREAYKDLVKVWHPDRFLHDPKLQAKAQEKLKQINEAYEKIKDYKPEKSGTQRKTDPKSPRNYNSQNETSARKKTEKPKSSPRNSTDNKTQSEDNGQSKTNVDNQPYSSKIEEDYTPFKVAQETIKNSNNFLPTIFVIVGIIGLVVFFIYKSKSQESKNSAKTENSNNKVVPLNNSNNVLATNSDEPLVIENISSQNSTNLKQKKVSDSNANKSNNVKENGNENNYVNAANLTELAPQTLQTVTPTPQTLVEQNKIIVQTKPEKKVVSNNGFFTIGSTKDDVLTAQGTPKSITGNTFGYDYSTVYFQNDRVTGWSNISRNLRVRMDSNSLTTESYFTVGSTKDDVIKIQGTPDNITGNTFGYGYSTVYFQNNQVKSWSNISNNLKVILKPKQ